MSQETAVIVRCKTCRRIIFAVANKPEALERYSGEITRLVIEGYDIVHVESESVRYEFGCQCEKEVQLDLSQTGGNNAIPD